MRTSNFLKTSERSKYLLCDGSEIPSSYSELRSLMTHTPDLRDRVPQGSGAYVVNTEIEPALPNITGYLSFRSGHNGESLFDASGAFYSKVDHYASSYQMTSINQRHFRAYFNASRSSSIYKDGCTTVQPPALALNFYIKAK